MTYFGITPSGVTVCLPQPVEVRFNRSEDAPADGFSGTFPLEKSYGNLTGIMIYDKNHEVCFDGIVDIQKESCADKMMLMLVARSRAALLLDNEAVPQTYGMPSLATIFARHVQPYGFTTFYGNVKAFNGELTITKGMSEWQAAAEFCTRFLHVKPRVLDRVFDASGTRPLNEIQFDNTGGIRYSAMTFENQYCRLLPDLMIQQGTDGTYCTVMKDETAAQMGIRRRRCLSSGQNAGNLIQAARRKAFCVKSECPGEIPAQLLQNASVHDKVLGTINGLYVSEIDYTLNSLEETTCFVLRRME